MPSANASATANSGTGGSWPSASAPLVRCSTTRQNVNVPSTKPITRRLNGSRTSRWITRGEYWLEPCWMISSATENEMLANVIVAAATVDRMALALSTVESPTQLPAWTPMDRRAPTNATTTATAGTKKKLARMVSASARNRYTPGTLRPIRRRPADDPDRTRTILVIVSVDDDRLERSARRTRRPGAVEPVEPSTERGLRAHRCAGIDRHRMLRLVVDHVDHPRAARPDPDRWWPPPPRSPTSSATSAERT